MEEEEEEEEGEKWEEEERGEEEGEEEEEWARRNRSWKGKLKVRANHISLTFLPFPPPLPATRPPELPHVSSRRRAKASGSTGSQL